MASRPILDLTTVNLDEVAVSKEAILELNAQRGEFEQVDKLISLDLEEGLDSKMVFEGEVTGTVI